MEVAVVEIDGIEYVVVKEFEYNSNRYSFLVNPNDSKDTFVRKIINENNQEYLIGLENEEELTSVLTYYLKTYGELS